MIPSRNSNGHHLTMRSTLITILWGAFAPNISAILVADGSPCGTSCGNVLDATTDDMIVCDEASYPLTSQGQVFESCISCESTSSYSTTEDSKNVSDLQYMLYNMRYATAKCLYEAATSPCITSFACGPLMEAVEYGNLSSQVTPYGYCSRWSDYQLEKCSDCLTNGDNGNFLRNFMAILSGACRLRLEPPATLPLKGSIFSTDMVNVTDPTPTATFDPNASNGPLSNGEIAGVVIGGVCVILALMGCGVVINGKRRRKAYLRRRGDISKNWPTPHGGNGGETFETPISQRPLRSWGDSPMSAATQTTFPPYFSPYVSQYSSPVSASDGPGNLAWPAENAQSIGVAISPDHDASVTHWGDKKGKAKADLDREEYALQETVSSAGGYGASIPHPHPSLPPQAPMLNHPGYGRYSPSQKPEHIPSWTDHVDHGGEAK
ncbi:hypothetical protein F5X99DRAFT_367241 [Biscogniauxia marginata]|nr:hypothetical protein F5X99DRAFT_367241 [Biscogniauxia marginata]